MIEDRACIWMARSASASVDEVSGVPQSSVLGPLLFILYASKLFRNAETYTVGYANDTTFYAFIPSLLLRPRVMESLKLDLAAINSWCLKWHTRLNLKKTKSMLVSRSRTIVPGYGVLTLDIGGAEFDEVKNLRILRVSLDSKLTFGTYLREVVSKAARSLGVERRVGKLFDCTCVLKSYFNAYVLSSLEYCAPV